jgi:hypothetical protein
LWPLHEDLPLIWLLARVIFVQQISSLARGRTGIDRQFVHHNFHFTPNKAIRRRVVAVRFSVINPAEASRGKVAHQMLSSLRRVCPRLTEPEDHLAWL